ncbi:MAG: hypothetical protein ACLRTR_03175 [Clostridia bacterium]
MTDMLELFTDFELIEELCEEMKKDDELAEKYSSLLNYFERNFYSICSK